MASAPTRDKRQATPLRSNGRLLLLNPRPARGLPLRLCRDKDEEFVDRLHADLQARGCPYASVRTNGGSYTRSTDPPVRPCTVAHRAVAGSRCWSMCCSATIRM